MNTPSDSGLTFLAQERCDGMASERLTCARCGGVIGPGGYVKNAGGKPEHLKCPPKDKARRK